MTKFFTGWLLFSLAWAWITDELAEPGLLEAIGMNPTLMIAGFAGTFFKVAYEVFPGWKIIVSRLIAGMFVGNYLGVFLADTFNVAPVFAGFMAGFSGILIVTFMQNKWFNYSETLETKKPKK